MTERARADLGFHVSGLSFPISKLLVVSIIAATAATGALIITVLVGMPGPPPGRGLEGMPPPAPLRSLAVFSVVTGLFVLTWLAVLVVFARDQVLGRIREIKNAATFDPETHRRQINEVLAEFRAELAGDRERELHRLSEHIATLTSAYGEERETDGYLNGMRVAAGQDPPESAVRSLRRLPRT
jgi:hypothetical protein